MQNGQQPGAPPPAAGARRRVLVAQPRLHPDGGGNGVAAWMLEALCDEHAVTLFTAAAPDLTAVDRFYGTALAGRDVRVVVAPGLAHRLVRHLPVRAGLLAETLFARAARRVAHDYDVVLTATNEVDLGRPVVQYIHYPARLRPRPGYDLRWYHARWALQGYYRLCDRLADASPRRLRANVSLANSQWTAALLRRHYDMAAEVVYPPVGTPAALPAWAARREAVICVGRLAPEKRIEMVLAIVGAARRQHPALQLTLVCPQVDDRYARRLYHRLRAERSWVTVEVGVDRARLAALLATHRYGLHAMAEEHFGMAVAEMTAAGCIVLVPDGGGAPEIVGRDPRLLWHTPADAVARLYAVLADPALQGELHAAALARARAFASDRFVAQIRALVDRLPRR